MKQRWFYSKVTRLIRTCAVGVNFASLYCVNRIYKNQIGTISSKDFVACNF